MFMLPMKFSDILPAARHGPVIAVNVNNSRCDSLILRPDHKDVLHIPLVKFTHKDANKLQQSLYAVLRCKSKLRSDRLQADLVSTSSGSTDLENRNSRAFSLSSGSALCDLY